MVSKREKKLSFQLHMLLFTILPSGSRFLGGTCFCCRLQIWIFANSSVGIFGVYTLHIYCDPRKNNNFIVFSLKIVEANERNACTSLKRNYPSVALDEIFLCHLMWIVFCT